MAGCAFNGENISTHALTEGDTEFQFLHTEYNLFQLTPSRRATSFHPDWGVVPVHFNSRPHGGRLQSGSYIPCIYFISTHALTEGDSSILSNSKISADFNSRPHGGRPGWPLWKLFSRIYFNSRPHGGRRNNRSYRLCRGSISTHALTEGDKQCIFVVRIKLISTHALTEGDQHTHSNKGVSVAFQLTPSRRATQNHA